MVRLTVLRYRGLFITTAAFMVILNIILWLHGSQAEDLMTQSVTVGCPTGPACHDLTIDAMDAYRTVGLPMGFVSLLPVAVGAFWGAPLLSREMEHGYASTSWTQSLSRRRWLYLQLAIMSGPLALFAIDLGLIVSWWAEQQRALMVSLGSHPQAISPATLGVGPICWWLAAFSIGVACGAILKSTVPAIALTCSVLAPLSIGLTFPAANVASGGMLSFPQLFSESPMNIAVLAVATAGSLFAAVLLTDRASPR